MPSLKSNDLSETEMYVTDEVDKPPNSFHVTCLDVVGLIYFIIFHFVRVGYDIYLTHAYFITGQYSYFWWTVTFTAIPIIIITLISLRMYVEDSRRSSSRRFAVLRIVLCVLGLILQSALVIRYWDSLMYAIKSLRAESQGDRKQQEKYYKKMLNEDSDVALLRVFECYFKSAPQQVLQITLMMIDYSNDSEVHMIKQYVMIMLSFVAMGWCMATYNRCIRFDQDDKKNISTLGTVVHFLWHLNLTVSRILSLSAIATLYPFWTSIAVACHWFGMTIWVAVTSKIEFGRKNVVFEVFFSGAVGLVYIFNFLSLKDGPTRKSYRVFYSLCFVENLIAVTFWGVKSYPTFHNWVYYVFVIVPIVTFVLGMTFLVTYYQCLHPNKTKSAAKNDEKGVVGSRFRNGVQTQAFREEERHGDQLNSKDLQAGVDT